MDEVFATLRQELSQLDADIAAVEQQHEVLALKGPIEQLRSSQEASEKALREQQAATAAVEATNATMQHEIDAMARTEADLILLRPQHAEKLSALFDRTAKIDEAKAKVDRVHGDIEVFRASGPPLLQSLDDYWAECVMGDEANRSSHERRAQRTGIAVCSHMGLLRILTRFEPTKAGPNGLHLFNDRAAALEQAQERSELEFQQAVHLAQHASDESAAANQVIRHAKDGAEAPLRRIMEEGRDMLDQMSAAFAREEKMLIAARKAIQDRNKELAFHLHRGTVDKRPTKMTPTEERLRGKYAQVNEAIGKLAQEHASTQAEVEELERCWSVVQQRFEGERTEYQKKIQLLRVTAAMYDRLLRRYVEEQEQWEKLRQELVPAAAKAKARPVPSSTAVPAGAAETTASSRPADAPAVPPTPVVSTRGLMSQPPTLRRRTV